MKNLLHFLDQLEDGSFGRRLRKAERDDLRGWRHYYHNPYRRIHHIKARCLVGMHVNKVYNKYADRLPAKYGRKLNNLLSFLGIEVFARDGCLIDARGNRYSWTRHYYDTIYYVNEDGIITKNPRYKPYRYKSSEKTEPHHIRIRRHMEAASKKRKEDREKRRLDKEVIDQRITLLFQERRRKARELEKQKLIQHGFDPLTSFRNVPLNS